MIITTDGHSIQAIAKPVVSGKRATLRLYPYGQPAFLPAGAIDWAATDAYNQPRPEPVKPVRIDPTLELPEKLPPGVTRTGGMIELWMSGGGRPSKTKPAEKTQATPASVLPLVPKDPIAAAAQITALGNEMQTLKDLQRSLYDSKQRLGQEVARLEAATANDAPISGVEVPKETPSQKELRRVRDDLKSVDDQIQDVERRMNEIRLQAVDLGGSVD
jgi:hypothetical protein